MSQESSLEGYSEPNDLWEIGSRDISINEQQITSSQKGKISAFGHNVVSSGRAEWDLQIDFESFGGITIGIYKHSRLTSKNGKSYIILKFFCLFFVFLNLIKLK